MAGDEDIERSEGLAGARQVLSDTGFSLSMAHKTLVESSRRERIQVTLRPGVLVRQRPKHKGRAFAFDLDTFGIDSKLFGSTDGLSPARSEYRCFHSGYTHILIPAKARRNPCTAASRGRDNKLEAVSEPGPRGNHRAGATTSNAPVSRRSSEEAPTITLKVPGSTTRRPCRLISSSAEAGNLNCSFLVSPAAM